MTREEFRDYVDFLRSQDEISYDVYSGLIDAIDTLEQEPKAGHYKDRREQRKVTEAMNALLLPLLPYLSSEIAIVVKRALHLLREIEVEPQEGSDKE